MDIIGGRALLARATSILVLAFTLCLVALPRSAHAGCIGPVIMGECKGQQVPWDTHAPEQQHPQAPPGFQWDWRGTQEERQRPTEINPFTGHDPHDSNWFNHGTRGNDEEDK